MSKASLGMSPSTAKRTGSFPDLSLKSVFGWSGLGRTEDVTVEQGGQAEDLRTKNTKNRGLTPSAFRGASSPLYENHHIGRADPFHDF